MKTNYVLKICIFLFFLLLGGNVWAKSLPLPRFASIRSNTVNVRSGPGLRYPIVFVYKVNNVPVEIVAEFDVWLKIRDADGDEGWVNRSMLSGKRNFIVNNKDGAVLYEKDDETFNPIAMLEKGVMGRVVNCKKTFDYCTIEVDEYKGVLRKIDIFGVYNYENIK